MRGTIPLGRLFGIPILVNPTWFVSLFLIVSILSLQVFPSVFPAQGAVVAWGFGLAGGIIFFLSILLHELGHCLVARHYAIPVKSITLFIFGGVSHIVRDAPRARAEMLMAGAGPAVSVAIGGLLLTVRLFILTQDNPFGLLVEWLGEVNLMLGIFNLLPGFPLDGGRLLRAVVWGISGNFPLATRIAALLGRITAYLLIILGLLTLLHISRWLPQNDPVGGVWLIVVGWFLSNAARQTQIQTNVLAFLGRYPAQRIMEADVPSVALDATLQDVAQALPSTSVGSACFVVDAGRVVGVVTREQLAQVPPAQWPALAARVIMVPAERVRPADPEIDAAMLLQRMDAEGLAWVPIVRGGTVEGLVTRAAVLGLLRGHREFRLSHS